MKNLFLLLSILSILAIVLAACGRKSIPTGVILQKETITVGIKGENPVLANVGIDALVDFADSLGKKTDFNDAGDNEVLKMLKSGEIDMVVSFDSIGRDKKLSHVRILKSDTDSLSVIVRQGEKELKDGFEAFMKSYHENGELLKVVRRYVSSPNDFMKALVMPFKFD